MPHMQPDTYRVLVFCRLARRDNGIAAGACDAKETYDNRECRIFPGQPQSGPMPVVRVPPLVRQLTALRAVAASPSPAVAHMAGGGNGSRTGSGLILARIAFNVLMRCDMK
jgi:hypothetical protein